MANSRVWWMTGLALVAFSVVSAQQRPSTPSPSITLKEVKMEFVAIPSGEFMMGCSQGDTTCGDPEKPSHRVRITKGFEMGKYEVTQEQFEALMGSNPSFFKGPNLPVDQANFVAVQEFIRILNAKKDAYLYRLPTEAEWEYAARAGKASYSRSEMNEMGWFNPNATAVADPNGRIHPVGQKKPNAWGLYDILGNVWEYCQDFYGENYFKSSPVDDPTGPATGTNHIRRGGSWNTPGPTTRLSFRQQGDLYTHTLGFRLVRVRQ